MNWLIVLDALFIVVYAAAVLILYNLGRIPHDIRILDLVLIILATARLSDIISTDQVMEWLRRPFVTLAPTEIAGHETTTRVGRGRGLRRTIGDLLSCPWCVGVWIAAVLSYLYFMFPTVMWLFILIMAVAEVASLFQTLSTIMVHTEKLQKGRGIKEEEESI